MGNNYLLTGMLSAWVVAQVCFIVIRGTLLNYDQKDNIAHCTCVHYGWHTCMAS